jgi:hypothetical protein
MIGVDPETARLGRLDRRRQIKFQLLAAVYRTAI